MATASAVGAALISACSPGEQTTPHTLSSTTTTTPTTAPPPSEAEEAPEADWIVQIGSESNDSFLAVSARGEEVVAGGWTEGTLALTNQGERDVLVGTVSTEGEVRNVVQAGTAATDEARAVAGEEPTHACGVSGSGSGAVSEPLEAWCSAVTASGDLEEVGTRGSELHDEINGASVNADTGTGYAVGSTEGFFPNATDPTPGLLGGGDVILWQLDSSSSPTWVRQFGTEANDRGTGVAALPDGDAVIVGETDGALSGQSAGGTDAFIGRLDESGTPRWIRQYGAESSETATAVAAGGERTRGTEVFVVAGATLSDLAPLFDADYSGLPDATESGFNSSGAAHGATPAQQAPEPEGPERDSGNEAPSEGTAGGSDAWVAAFDSAGELIWALQIGSPEFDAADAVALDGSTVLLAGTTEGAINTENAPAAGGSDGFLAALDATDGSVRWITQFGTPEDDSAHGITVTEDGLAVVAGRTAGQLGDEIHAGGDDAFLIAFPLPSSGGGAASIL